MPYTIAHSHLDSAICLYDKGKFKEALQELRKARESLGDDPEGLRQHISRYMAKCLSELGK